MCRMVCEASPLPPFRVKGRPAPIAATYMALISPAVGVNVTEQSMARPKAPASQTNRTTRSTT